MRRVAIDSPASGIREQFTTVHFPLDNDGTARPQTFKIL